MTAARAAVTGEEGEEADSFFAALHDSPARSSARGENQSVPGNALATGGSSGIGLAIARALGAEGYGLTLAA